MVFMIPSWFSASLFLLATGQARCQATNIGKDASKLFIVYLFTGESRHTRVSNSSADHFDNFSITFVFAGEFLAFQRFTGMQKIAACGMTAGTSSFFKKYFAFNNANAIRGCNDWMSPQEKPKNKNDKLKYFPFILCFWHALRSYLTY